MTRVTFARGAPRRRGTIRTLTLAWLLAATAPLSAQDGDELLRLQVSPAGAVQIEIGDVLSAGGIQQSLESGLPVRVRVVTERCRCQFFLLKWILLYDISHLI